MNKDQGENDMKYRINLCLMLAVVFLFAAGRPAKANPLIEAASAGDMVKVRVLLENGADANAKTNTGATALMFAVQKDHTDTVQALLAKDANVNAKNYIEQTALMFAEQLGYNGTVRILKEAGAKE
jgi:ankyrin repeat protein